MNICESCGDSADNFVVDTKQWFCLDCALGLPKGSIAQKGDNENRADVRDEADLGGKVRE